MPPTARPTAPRSDDAGPGTPPDPRIAAFCSAEHPEVFHAVAGYSDIWKDDPFDVDSIHEEARDTFQRLVHRATNPSGPAAGRMLLLQGEAGSGKTHLMRAFRNWAHTRGRGYCGYLQMTSATNQYGRYVLYNLLDSLDHPYDERAGETSGLMRLSTAIAESTRGVPQDRLDQIRNDELDYGCLAKLINALADQIVMDDRFNDIDLDLIRALLYLQANDPRVKGRVIKYLRCEDLSLDDRSILGGIVPRAYEDAPQWLIQRLGELMGALESVPLILCVDQLEDIYNLDDAAMRFRRAISSLCDLASRTPNAVVVISCLEDFYEVLKKGLTRSLTDRIERDPSPIVLKGIRDQEEVARIVSQRLKFLYDSLDAPFREDDPTFPFSMSYLRQLAGTRTRDILLRCQEYRERCLALGQLADLEVEVDSPGPPSPGSVGMTRLEQAWNDYRSGFQGEISSEDEHLAALLAEAIRACTDEIETGYWYEAEADGRIIPIECHAPDNSVVRILVGVCNMTARGGLLGRKIAEVEQRAGEHTPVIVRSTEFPSSPTTAISRQIGELITRGGRRVVVEDSDWRAMLALPRFREEHHGDPAFGAWLKEGKPLSRLRSLRAILDLDRPRAARPVAPPEAPVWEEPAEAPAPEPTPEPAPDGEATGPDEDGPIVVGTADDRLRGPVALEPAELTRHAAFLGGTGSGKTTVALNVVEQLLLRGIPAILVDRKGDLCGYARDDAWSRPIADEALAARRDRLRGRVEVAVYTPGNPQGRPLSIAIAPAGLGRLGSFERAQVARYAASALAGMMNYGNRGTDPARQAILASAIEQLSQIEAEGVPTLEGLIDYIAEGDPTLVNAVGRLDTKLFDKLVQDLETLRLTRGEFLASRGEPMEPEALLGLGRRATPGKTRLSVISTKFLGTTQDVQFWVSQLLVEMARWASRSPSGRLQAVLLFDEADLYLPAQRQPPTKGPMEDLLKRARSAGLGLLLATQSPGDFDYKCRDNIRSWFVGRVKEPVALAKMKPMLSECRIDVASRLPGQEPGQFHLLRDGAVAGLRADRSAVPAEQLPEEEILALARRTRPQV